MWRQFKVENGKYQWNKPWLKIGLVKVNTSEKAMKFEVMH